MEITGVAMERGGVVGTQVGGAIAVVGGFTLNELMAVAGFALACVSFCFQVFVTIYYKEKHYRLAVARLENDLEEKADDE